MLQWSEMFLFFLNHCGVFVHFKVATKALEASKTASIHLTVVWLERLRHNLLWCSTDSMTLSKLKEKCLKVSNQDEIREVHNKARILWKVRYLGCYSHNLICSTVVMNKWIIKFILVSISNRTWWEVRGPATSHARTPWFQLLGDPVRLLIICPMWMIQVMTPSCLKTSPMWQWSHGVYSQSPHRALPVRENFLYWICYPRTQNTSQSWYSGWILFLHSNCISRDNIWIAYLILFARCNHSSPFSWQIIRAPFKPLSLHQCEGTDVGGGRCRAGTVRCSLGWQITSSGGGQMYHFKETEAAWMWRRFKVCGWQVFKRSPYRQV